jgi:transposase
MKTITRKVITAKGVKPIGRVQWQRQAYYLYGVVEPVSGDSFFYEFSHLDSLCFEYFLKFMSQEFPDSINIVHLDGAGAHAAKSLRIPDNIVLLFQPPHCPQLNPIERFWQHLKQFFAWHNYERLEQLQIEVSEVLFSFSKNVISSLCGWEYITNALYVAGIS